MSASTMHVVEIVQPGKADVLEASERPMPRPAADEILIDVEASGINRPDVIQRLGLYPPPQGASDIPGLEIAGRVNALGSGVTKWQIGDAVTALVSGGGYASHCIAHSDVALPAPNGLSMIEAAALPETFFTVWSNMFDRAELQAGEWLLVHGGSSGIGTTAIQLAKAFGAMVIVTAGSDEKCDACLKLGADAAINYHKDDYVAAVKDITSSKGANVILDMVGGDYVERNYSAAAIEGRIIQIALLNGPSQSINFTKLMLKRLVHTGSTLRARSNEFKADIAANLLKNVWPLLEKGQIKPIIDSTFDFPDAASAHARMEGSSHIGKIVMVHR